MKHMRRHEPLSRFVLITSMQLLMLSFDFLYNSPIDRLPT